ncbi:MAG: hypothetical protein FWG20_03725 [Candidatus Cloacimonetes bacterium]|nr:hypothetical protein [Candidatus Cloacimonadota bacterium]
MSYIVEKILTKDLGCETVDGLSFWNKPSLLTAYTERDGTNLCYLQVTDKGKVVAVMAIIEKMMYGITYISQAHEQFYTSIDIFLPNEQNIHSAEFERNSIYKAIAWFLKKHYCKIHLNLDYHTIDIRPFLWAGYKAKPQYTYVVSPGKYSKNDLTQSIRAEIKKGENNELYVSENWDLSVCEVLSQELATRKNRAFRQTEKQYHAFWDSLHTAGLCEMATVYQKDTPLTFFITLIDHQIKNLYTLSIATSELGVKLKSSIYCYDNLFQKYKDFSRFDLSGANVENIAYFKSKFNSTLVPYFRIEKDMWR